MARTHVPAFFGRAESFANFEEKVMPRKQIAAMEPDEKAAHFLLRTSDAARRVCKAAGKDFVRNLGGAGQILKIPRKLFAPGAIDRISQDMAEIMYARISYKPGYRRVTDGIRHVSPKSWGANDYGRRPSR